MQTNDVCSCEILYKLMSKWMSVTNFSSLKTPKQLKNFKKKPKAEGNWKTEIISLQSWKHCNELAQKNEALRLAAVLSGPWACILWSRKISMNSLDIIQNRRKKQLSRKVHSYCFDFFPFKLSSNSSKFFCDPRSEICQN